MLKVNLYIKHFLLDLDKAKTTDKESRKSRIKAGLKTAWDVTKQVLTHPFKSLFCLMKGKGKEIAEAGKNVGVSDVAEAVRNTKAFAGLFI
jgi:formiminotetrahydrofolate cyclodeaminase